jgi:regulatory helix-turn-helix LysR family protein
MDLRHLRYSSGIVEAGDMVLVAHRLHVSQPPLSRQMRDLEPSGALAPGDKTCRLRTLASNTYDAYHSCSKGMRPEWS